MAVQISGNDITVPRDGSFTRNVTIGGTLTYEDVTNIDSVGLVTARTGIEIGARPGVAASISVDGNMIISGISTFGDDITFTGATSGRDVVFDTSLNQMRAQDNAKLCAGTSSDLEIFHNGTNSLIDNYTGALLLRNNVSSDNGGNIVIQAKVNEDSIVCNDDGAVELYHDNERKIYTHATGIQVEDATSTGASIVMATSSGTSGSLYATGNNTLGLLDGQNHYMLKGVKDGAVELYYDNSKVFETTSVGVNITGQSTFVRNAGDANFIVGSTNASGAYLVLDGDSNGDAAGGDYAYLLHNSSGNLIIDTRNPGGNSQMQFNVNGSERLRIASDGKIGVNNSSPSAAIEVTFDSGGSAPSSGTAPEGIAISYGTSDNKNGGIWFSPGFGDDQGISGICGTRTSGYQTDLRFYTNNTNSARAFTERLRILPDGQIFSNGLDGSVDITVTSAADTYDGIQMGKPPFRVTRTSNVPAYLNRNGSGGNIIQFRYGGGVVGSISNNSNSLPSDRNYKKNITNLSLGLDLVNKLQPVSYHYKFDADSDPVMYGLVAQDVETALNDAGVAQNTAAILQYEEKNDEKDSDYSLDYIKLTPILINAVKELSAEIESLKSEIAALKSN